MTETEQLCIRVEPEPDDREMAAITAAVLTLSPHPREPEPKSAPNPWREAGKRETIRAALQEECS